MVKQTHPNVHSEIEKLNEREVNAVVSYISQILSNRISKSKDSKPGDDLIVSLSETYENRRARQVMEWERVRRQNAQRAV